MAPKIIAALVTILINLAVGVVVLSSMLLAMNGYSESDALWGLGVFVVLALIVTVVMGSCAFFGSGMLLRRQFSGAAAAILTILAFSVTGTVVKIICSIIGIGVAEFVRVNY